MADTIIDAQEIIDEFGSFYVDEGQNTESIITRPKEKFGTKDALHMHETNNTELHLEEAEMEEIIQGYQDGYTPKGSVKFSPIRVPLTQIKIDQEFNPNSLANTWNGFLTNNNVDRSQWPFIRWFIEKYLLGQADKDIEMKSIYHGKKVAPVPGTAGAAIEAMDGIKAQINAGITAGKISPIVTGELAINPVDFVTQLEEFTKAIPEIFWEQDMKLNLSKKLWRRYKEGRRAKYNGQYSQVTDLTLIEDTNINVVGRDSMYGSDKIWASLPGNYVFGVKGFSNKNGFEIEKAKRKVAIYTDWWMSPGFLLPDQIFTNDRDLV